MGTEGFEPIDDSRPVQTLRDFRSGQKVFSRYVLTRMLGRGGMGVVWLSHDTKLDQDVALKFLPDAVRQDPNAVDELKRETRRSLKLTHPNIVRIYDFVDEHTVAAISMEFVDGHTFGALRAEQPQKIFSPARILPYVKQLGAAFDYAHVDAKTVHRDIKPSNIMVNTRGQIKVADFGIARSVSDSMTRITMHQGTSGTLAYMSPQQLSGLPSKPTDDVYALGATLYELLAGRPPFYTGDITYQIRELTPPRIADRREELEIEAEPVPELWEQVIASCLAKNPDRRPQSAGEIYTRLAAMTPPTTYIVMPKPDAKPVVRPKPVESAPAMPASTVVIPRAKIPPPPVTPPPEPPAEPPRPPESPPVEEPAPELESPIEEPAAEPEPEIHAVELESEAPLFSKPRSRVNWVAVALFTALVALAVWYFGAKRPAQVANENARIEADKADRLAADARKRVEAKRLEDLGKPPQIISVPGQFNTIQAAINSARAGDTVHVKAGHYEEMLGFKDGIKLEGDGAENTIITCIPEPGRSALTAKNCATGLISGFTFQHSTAYSDDSGMGVVTLSGCNLELSRCKILNGRGPGLLIVGGTNAVHDCELRSNAWAGIYVFSNAFTQIKDNTCAQNKQFGIYFIDGPSGVVVSNTCDQNGNYGILIGGGATSATLLNNHCGENSQCGIAFINSAKGAATGNRCEKNRDEGILISGGSVIEVVSNQCSHNTYGMGFREGSGGRVERNNCSNNSGSGIFLQQKGTSPKLIANDCRDNDNWGIYCIDGATPEIADNVLLGNIKGEIDCGH